MKLDDRHFHLAHGRDRGPRARRNGSRPGRCGLADRTAKAVTPTSFLAKTLHPASVTPSAPAAATARAASRRRTGGRGTRSAEELRALGEFLRSIVAAPAVTSPVAGLPRRDRGGAKAAAGRRIVERGHRQAVPQRPDRTAAPTSGSASVLRHRPDDRAHALGIASSTPASASGGVWRSDEQGRPLAAGQRRAARLAVGALATDPSDGSVWVGTGEANNASENQYGVGVYRLAKGSNTWRRVGGTELNGAGSYRIVWIRGYVYVATSHGLYRRSVEGHGRRAPGSSCSRRRARGLPAELVGDRRHRRARHATARKVLAVVGWAGYSNPPGDREQRVLRRQRRPGSFTRVTPTGDINPATIGRTTLQLVATAGSTPSSRTPPPRTSAARAPSCRRPATRPARGRGSPTPTSSPASGSALGDSTSSYYPGVQADYNQDITADPKDRQHVYLQLEEVFESTNGGATWNTVGPYWNFDISCEQANGNPYDVPADHPPRPARRHDLRRPVLGRQRRRRLAAPADVARPRPLDQPQRHAAHHAELLDRRRQGRRTAWPTGAACRTTASRTPAPTCLTSSRRSPVTAATRSSTRRTATVRSRSTSTSTCTSRPTAR